jgi:hypothetical protein
MYAESPLYLSECTSDCVSFIYLANTRLKIFAAIPFSYNKQVSCGLHHTAIVAEDGVLWTFIECSLNVH